MFLFLKVLNELGQCLILLYNKFGDEFINYLELTYLPTLNLGAQVTQVRHDIEIFLIFKMTKNREKKGNFLAYN